MRPTAAHEDAAPDAQSTDTQSQTSDARNTEIIERDARFVSQDEMTVGVLVERAAGFEPTVLDGRLLDLSRGGAKLVACEPIPFDDAARLQIKVPSLAVDLQVPIEVCWTRPHGDEWLIGCAFDPKLPTELLEQLASGGFLDRRQETRRRVRLRASACWELSEASIEVELQDLSSGGFSMLSPQQSKTGQRLLLHVDSSETGRTSIPARIQWQMSVADQYLIGCTFVNSADCHLLAAASEAVAIDEEVAAPVEPPARLPWGWALMFALLAFTGATSVIWVMDVFNSTPKVVTLPPVDLTPDQVAAEAELAPETGDPHPDQGLDDEADAPPSDSASANAGAELATEGTPIDIEASITATIVDGRELPSRPLNEPTVDAVADELVESVETTPETPVVDVIVVEPLDLIDGHDRSEPDDAAFATNPPHEPVAADDAEPPAADPDDDYALPPVVEHPLLVDEPARRSLDPIDPTVGTSIANDAVIDEPAAVLEPATESASPPPPVQDPQVASEAFARGDEYYRRGQYQLANRAFQRAVDRAQDNPFYRYVLALSLYELSEREAAAEQVRLAVELEGNQPIAGWGQRMMRYQGRSRLWLEGMRSR